MMKINMNTTKNTESLEVLLHKSKYSMIDLKVYNELIDIAKDDEVLYQLYRQDKAKIYKTLNLRKY